MNRPGPVLLYTTARVGVFAVVLALLYLLGMRHVLLLLAAVVVSGLLSYVLLGRLRDAVSASVLARGHAVRTRFRERTEAEDAADEARRAREEHGAPDADDDPPV